MNATGLNSTSVTTARQIAPQGQSKPSFYVIQLVMMLIIAAAGTISNASVIFVLANRRNRGKISTILLLNLAICNILVSSICIPLDITDLVYQKWVFGDGLCNVIYPFQTSLPIASSYTLLFMMCERHLLFMKSFRSKFRAKTIRIFACITWILPLLVVLPYGLKKKKNLSSR